jgi:hypothetical protein
MKSQGQEGWLAPALFLFKNGKLKLTENVTAGSEKYLKQAGASHPS